MICTHVSNCGGSGVRHALRPLQSRTEELLETLIGAPAELSQEPYMVTEAEEIIGGRLQSLLQKSK
jgi:hypothetical protein